MHIVGIHHKRSRAEQRIGRGDRAIDVCQRDQAEFGEWGLYGPDGEGWKWVEYKEYYCAGGASGEGCGAWWKSGGMKSIEYQ